MDIQKYVESFGVSGIDERLNSDYLMHFMYTTYVNKFKTQISRDEMELFKEYESRMFDFVEDIRSLELNEIKNIFKFLHEKKNYLIDLVIILWSLPRPDTFLSTQMYDNSYKKNIAEFNGKLLELADQDAIGVFTNLVISTSVYVPIHCIDLIWYQIQTTQIEFSFVNKLNSNYIKIENDSKFVRIYLNIEKVIFMGLGKISNNHDYILCNIINQIITDENVIGEMVKSESKKEYVRQLCSLRGSYEEIFGKPLNPLSEKITSVIDGIKSK